MANGNESGYFDKYKKKIWIIVLSLSLFFLFLELFITRHGHFGESSIDGWFSFYGGLGLLASMVCVLVANGLGVFLKVEEEYYD